MPHAKQTAGGGGESSSESVRTLPTSLKVGPKGELDAVGMSEMLFASEGYLVLRLGDSALDLLAVHHRSGGVVFVCAAASNAQLLPRLVAIMGRPQLGRMAGARSVRLVAQVWSRAEGRTNCHTLELRASDFPAAG
jgi:hypothetical protein